MRIRKRQVPLPLSSLLPVPLSDLYFNRSPSATSPYFCGGSTDGDGAGVGGGGAFPISDGLIQRDLVMGKNKKDDDDGDVDVKSSIDASGSKNNVDPRGESDSLTQVVEEKEKVVSLRKRRSYRSFEEEDEYEEEEEEEEASTRSKKGKKRAKKNGMLEEGSRCSRVNGRGWRCCQQTLVGYSLCEHHLGKGRVRSMNKSKGAEKKAAVVVEVKKKRVKLGMVKARSINSLLGQTSTTNVVDAPAAVTESEISALPDQFVA